jgi:hypothetical protein
MKGSIESKYLVKAHPDKVPVPNWVRLQHTYLDKLPEHHRDGRVPEVEDHGPPREDI